MAKTPPKKLYCYKCGAEMNKRVYIDHYDQETGKPVEYTEFTCTRGFIVHDKDVFNSKGMKLVII